MLNPSPIKTYFDNVTTEMFVAIAKSFWKYDTFVTYFFHKLFENKFIAMQQRHKKVRKAFHLKNSKGKQRSVYGMVIFTYF